MRCSECSKVVKPIVAIDIDGTLGDYHTHFQLFSYAYLGKEVQRSDGMPKLGSYDGRLQYSRWCMAYFDITLEEYRAIKLAYRQGAQKRSMPIFKGAKNLVASARALGCEVWVTTTRPYMRLDNIDPDTRFWLDHHSILFDGLLYDEDKYRVLADRVDMERVIAVFDDQPDQYDAASDEFGPSVPVMVKTKYNRGVLRPNSCIITSAHIALRGRYDHWEQEHGV